MDLFAILLTFVHLLHLYHVKKKILVLSLKHLVCLTKLPFPWHLPQRQIHEYHKAPLLNPFLRAHYKFLIKNIISSYCKNKDSNVTNNKKVGHIFFYTEHSFLPVLPLINLRQLQDLVRQFQSLNDNEFNCGSLCFTNENKSLVVSMAFWFHLIRSTENAAFYNSCRLRLLKRTLQKISNLPAESSHYCLFSCPPLLLYITHNPFP